MTDRAVFWFRRDLRLGDQPALRAAADGGRPVLALFVLDDVLLQPAGAARRSFLFASLDALRRDLSSALVIRSGDPALVVPQVAREVGADEVFATADFGPYGTVRDEEVTTAVEAAGRSIHFVDSPYAVAPGSVTTGSGGTYKVFTPFYRAWKAHGWAAPVPPARVDWIDALASDEIPSPPDLPSPLPPVGEEAAMERLDRFLDGPILSYADDRDRPGIDGTSLLSPHLKWGAIHPRQVLARLGGDPAEDVFRSEIAWREFYADVLHTWPHSARGAFVERMAAMEVDSGPATRERFDAWAQGRTGYPIVDAGMRQLLATGWMHNRVRMIVASFLVKDLHLDWKRGADWFMSHLLDGDLASNNHGWQWVAGTGTDASPYFRIFNPVSQGKKFDPDGRYIRRWVPEIAHLADRHLHEPWADPHGPPAAYPSPIVDHAEERAESLARYEALKEDWG